MHLHNSKSLFERISDEGDDVQACEGCCIALIILASLRQSVAHANDLSTTHLLGRSTKPRLASGSFTTSSLIPSAAAASAAL
jgi:hypothetical protein